MCSIHGVFCVLTRWNALTPSLRATPRPRAGEGPGVRAFGALQGQKTAKHSNVLSALKLNGRGASDSVRKRDLQYTPFSS
jgi:hypothetical protein